MMGEVDMAVERLRPFAEGLGVDEVTLRLIVLTVWTDRAERSLLEKIVEVRRQLMKAMGV